MGWIRDTISKAISRQKEDAALHEKHQRQLEETGNPDLYELWLDLDPDLRARAVKIILDELPADVMDDLVKRCFVDGEDWYITHHHGWGTSIRNLLRSKGLRDEQVPSGNLDDYYGCAVNEAIWEYAEEPIRKEREELHRLIALAQGRVASS